MQIVGHTFCHVGVSEYDKELFFGPIEPDEEIVPFDDSWIMAHVMNRAGLFSSVGQARKNGWNKPVPLGYSEFVVGKMKHRVWILNKLPITAGHDGQ